MSSAQPSKSPAPVNRRYSPSPGKDADAGLRARHHYERRLPAWRHKLRESLIPILRWETPHLAAIQNACRSPFLDSYFAFTANLGTHTFFMTFLPICFWCGYAGIGISLVHMLGLGVYASGALKDLVCLPRPLSPPLQRITMSGSAALEYGFPSTHTTNAVSVAIFAFHQLHLTRHDWSPVSYSLLCMACCCYAISITVGRVYCGMHGFSDVIIGAVLGAIIAWLRIAYGPAFDAWVIEGGWLRPAIAVIVLLLAVRFHPEPADDCPCFDDSVAFLGVIMGTAIGTWRYATLFVPGHQTLADMYPRNNENLLKSAARLVLGILVIFLWRAAMKRLLLTYLPPIYRFVGSWGVRMPRRYFLQARDYKRVPPLRKDDNVIPSAAEIPSMLSRMRNPRQRRISVGPQSEADAREHLANRREQRRLRRANSSPRQPGRESESESALRRPTDTLQVRRQTYAASLPSSSAALLTPPASDAGATSSDGESGREDDSAFFSALLKPRTHYDVEVVTKLVVYAGIAWLAVERNLLWFEALGLI